jgi:hypothetical protein
MRLGNALACLNFEPISNLMFAVDGCDGMVKFHASLALAAVVQLAGHQN